MATVYITHDTNEFFGDNEKHYELLKDFNKKDVHLSSMVDDLKSIIENINRPGIKLAISIRFDH